MSTVRLRYCPIVGCENFRGTADQDVRFFYTSNVDNKELLSKWVEAIRTYMPDFPKTMSRLRICQLHFDPTDMKLARGQLRLNSGSIPKRFPFEKTKIKQEIVPGVPVTLRKIKIYRKLNESIKQPQSVQDPLTILRKSQNGAVSACSRCVDYKVQLQLMQGEMRELQEQIKEQQFEITMLHKRNEYLKEFEPDNVQKREECSVCKLKLTADELYLHMCRQLDDKSDAIQCEYCSKSYDSTLKLINHLKVSHNKYDDKLYYHCKKCPRIFQMSKLMDIHDKAHSDEIPCKKCPQTFLTQHDYDEHMQKQHRPLKPFQCGFDNCSEKFCSASLLRDHVSDYHEPPRPGGFKPSQRLKKANENITFECYLCQKNTFPAIRDVRLHVKEHGIPSMDKCLVCSSKMYTSDLGLHLCENVAQSDGGSINCDYCSEKFQSITKLFQHIDDKHAKDKTLYRCIKCPNTYPMKNLLECHSIVHTKEIFKCNKCSRNRSFATLDALKMHIKRHETKGVHLCDLCGSVLKSERNLKIHKQSQHSMGEPQYSCSRCPKKFFVSTQLRKHQIFHSKESFSCHFENCDFKCSSSDRLGVHIKLHTHPKEKRLECTMCTFKCSERNRLKHHLSTVHTTIRQFQCEYCPRSYKHKGDLNKHLRTHLGDEMYACPEPNCSKRFRLELDLLKHASDHYVEQKNKVIDT